MKTNHERQVGDIRDGAIVILVGRGANLGGEEGLADDSPVVGRPPPDVGQQQHHAACKMGARGHDVDGEELSETRCVGGEESSKMRSAGHDAAAETLAMARGRGRAPETGSNGPSRSGGRRGRRTARGGGRRRNRPALVSA